jgi:TRAP-type C4-dicarboxylate transport system substrate-binding protein
MGNFWLCANPDRWNALPRDVQESVERNASKYVDLFRADMVRANEEAGARLKSRLEFNWTDTSGFVERLKESGFYQRWRKEFGERAWTLLEQKRGRPLP